MRPSEADLALVRGLVEIPSLSRREGEAVEWLVARMAERGFRASVDDAGNAVGEIGDGPFHVVLLGHIDTVPGEIPVRVEGDELVGRGVGLSVWAVVDEVSDWDPLGQLRQAAVVIAVPVRDDQIVDLGHAGIFRGGSNTLDEFRA